MADGRDGAFASVGLEWNLSQVGKVAVCPERRCPFQAPGKDSGEHVPMTSAG